MKKFHLFFSLLFSFNLFSQPVIHWQNSIGGSNGDAARVIKQTFDNGYILGGISNSNISGDKTENCRGAIDFWIVKIDSLGLVEWDKTVGGADEDDLFDLDQTSDSGFIFGGRTYSGISGDKTDSSRGVTDFWIVKVDASGNIQWQKTIGGSYDDEIQTVLQTIDGGFIVGGNSNSDISGDKTENCKGILDIWILKLDALGNILWQKTIGGNDFDVLQSMKQTSDGGYILGGVSSSNISGDKSENSMNGSSDFWILKLDSLGTIQWQNTIGGNNVDDIEFISQTIDGGYISGGASNSDISGDKSENSRGLDDYWILKLDPTGNIQWQKTIGGNKVDRLYSVGQNSNGSFLTAGYSNSDLSSDKTENSKGFEDYWIVKLDNSGNLHWQKTIGGNGDDELLSMQVTKDAEYIMAGVSLSGISGDKTENNVGSSDFWVIKTSIDTYVSENDLFDQVKVYPNPASSYLNIGFIPLRNYQICITNILGKTLAEYKNDATFLQIDISDFPDGIYYFILSDNTKNRFVKRFIKSGY